MFFAPCATQSEFQRPASWQQSKTQGLPQTRARTGAPPTDARSENSGKRQQRQQRLARTKEANATTHRRPYTARLPLAEPNTGRARDMHCTHEGTEAENEQSARGGTVQRRPEAEKDPTAEKGTKPKRVAELQEEHTTRPKAPKGPEHNSSNTTAAQALHCV